MVTYLMRNARRRTAGVGARPEPSADERAERLRRLLAVAGVITAMVIVASTAAAGLPNSAGGKVGVVGLTAAAVGCWLACLTRRVSDPRLLLALLLVTGLSGAWLDVLRPSGPGFILAYMAMAGLGLLLPARIAIGGGVLVIVAAGLAEAHTSAHPLSSALNLSAGAAFLFLAAAFAGVSRDANAQARALLEQQEAARAAREEAAVLAERSRLAREMHDVLAHTLSGLAVQLEGTRLLASKVSADARLVEQITSAQQLARDGLASVRRAVSTLRGDKLPGPADLPQLVESVRLSGLPTTFEHSGEPRALPGEHGLAIYRTVQEALTNTRKYAGAGASAAVTLTWSEDVVCVEVVDHGGDHAPSGLPSSGFGLTGLAERAALAGGRLERGPAGDGFRVCLTVPVQHAG
jgi:signal transduction histidine kinase